MGAVFATNAKAYSRWRRTVDRAAGKKQGVSGLQLEAAVSQLALTNPEYVVVAA